MGEGPQSITNQNSTINKESSNQRSKINNFSMCRDRQLECAPDRLAGWGDTTLSVVVALQTSLA
jgi:hypothetical protein